jgi:hypothetical protein
MGFYRLKHKTRSDGGKLDISFEQRSRPFRQARDWLTNPVVDCLLTTQARGGATMEGELVCVVLQFHDETDNSNRFVRKQRQRIIES